MNEPRFIATDMSHQVFGKYRTCFKFEDHWYSDEDEGPMAARPKDGSVARDGFVYRQPLFTRELFQRVFNEDLNRRMEFLASLPPSTFARPPWHIAQWNLFKSRVRRTREWLGEKIAGREFDDGY